MKKYQSKQKNEVAPKGAVKSGKKSKVAVNKKSKTSKKSKSPAKPATKAAKKQTVATDDEEEQDWEVEKIIDVRYNEDGAKNFLIRWKGCDPTQDTWEPESNVNSPDLVNAFMSKADGADDAGAAPKKKSRKA